MFSGSSGLKRTTSERGGRVTFSHISCPGSPSLSVVSAVERDHFVPSSVLSVTDSPSSCKINTLLLVVHAGSILG